MRVLITGYSGFAGGHLAEDILANTDWQVWGTVFGPPTTASIADPRLREVPADLSDPSELRRVVDAALPDLVFHLAGQSSVRDSWANPWPTFDTNVRLQLDLTLALAERGLSPRTVVITSNEVYGAVPTGAGPAGEDTPLAPTNPYGVSKVAQDMLAQLYAASHALDIVRVRPFTHIGPRQSDSFVAASFARQVAEIEAGLREPELLVGNLDAERDFSDVRDIVRGYRLVAQRGTAGDVYNLGSGTSRSIRSVLEALVERSGVPIRVRTDPERMRPSDVPRTWCDASKARHKLGWEPRIPFETTVDDILDDWRARTQRGAV